MMIGNTQVKNVNSNALEYLENYSGIITLVGSTRFWDEYVSANRHLTLAGWAVFSCGHFGHSYHKKLDMSTLNERCKKLHFMKIKQSDAICIVRPDYVGSSTKREIEYARQQDKTILEYIPTSTHDGYFRLIHRATKPQRLEQFLNSDFQKFASEGLGY